VFLGGVFAVWVFESVCGCLNRLFSKKINFKQPGFSIGKTGASIDNFSVFLCFSGKIFDVKAKDF